MNQQPLAHASLQWDTGEEDDITYASQENAWILQKAFSAKLSSIEFAA